MKKKVNGFLFILLLFGFIIFYLFGGNIFGYAYYPFDTFNYARNYNVNSIIEIYNANSGWFDFFIFLFIFLSLSKAVFGEHFKDAKGVYIGVGFFLALALVLWESRTGYSLFTLFGPFVVALLFIVIVIGLFFGLKKVGAGAMMAISIIYLVLYFLFKSYLNRLGIFDELRYTGFSIEPWLNFLLPIAILVLLFSIIYLIFKGRS